MLTQRCYVGLPAVAVDTLFHTIIYRKGKPYIVSSLYWSSCINIFLDPQLKPLALVFSLELGVSVYGPDLISGCWPSNERYALHYAIHEQISHQFACLLSVAHFSVLMAQLIVSSFKCV